MPKDEYVQEEEEDVARDIVEEVELDKGGNRVGQIVSASHIDDHDYIDDDLVLDVAGIVLDNPYNDFNRLDGNSDLHDLDIDLDDFQDQFNMEL